jgi:hypothetical protein
MANMLVFAVILILINLAVTYPGARIYIVAGIITIGLIIALYYLYSVFFKLYQRKRKNQEIDKFRHQLNSLGLIHENKFAREQYEVYCLVWENLQELRSKVELLWRFANPLDLWDYNVRVKEIEAITRKNALFFEEKDYSSLTEIMRPLKKYGQGKGEILQLWPSIFGSKSVRDAVALNKVNKETYEKLLERLRVSFKGKLASSLSMNEDSNLAESKRQLTRRLQVLELRKARGGFNTPPEVILEIEDIQEALSKIEHKRDSSN